MLSPRTRRSSPPVTFTYYDQLNGYRHLKSLGVGHHFYQGRYDPSEWFIAPLPVIDQAINMILTGDIVDVVYDRTSQKLVPLAHH